MTIKISASEPACAMDLSGLTLGICSSRIASVAGQLLGHREEFETVDKVLVVLDSDDEIEYLREQCSGMANIEIRSNFGNRGLSFSRNVILKSCPTRYLLFLDDDVKVSMEVLKAALVEFRGGRHLVGAKLIPPEAVEFPWYINHGQYHYFGIHSPHASYLPIWGAFLGVNAAFARRHEAWFDEALGRKSGKLQSGDDTSFVAYLNSRNANSCVLEAHPVIHYLSPNKIALTYLLRRAWWQGRSEARRRSALRGILKEVRRNFLLPLTFWSLLVGFVCVLLVTLGAICESAYHLGRGSS